MKYTTNILVIFFIFSCGGGGSSGSAVLNKPPVINGLEDSITIPENQTSVVSVSASDPETGTLTYFLTGTDSASLSISINGVITFNTAPDYEAKNSYSINVNVSDGEASVNQALIVNISDVIEPYQTQLGANLVGESNGDEFGYSVSLSSDGSFLAIGGPGNNNDTGHVRIFSWDGSTWTQRGNDIDGAGQMDESARSISLSHDGNKVAVGAPMGFGSHGEVEVYEWDGADWNKFKDDLRGWTANDNFGTSVDMTNFIGPILISGMPGNDEEGNNAGSIRVWFNTDSSLLSWSLRDEIRDGEAGDQFGTSVSMSLNAQIIAIGAPFHDQTKGRVKIYEFNAPNNDYIQLSNDIDGEANGDQSGTSVELSSDGSTIAIGAMLNDGNGNDAGHVRVFVWDGMSWLQRGVDIDGDSAGDQFGADVSLNSDGTILAVSSTQHNNSTGYVKVYDWNGSSWVLSGNIISGSSSGDSCGESISLSDDGSILAVGCPSTQNTPGYARVYQR